MNRSLSLLLATAIFLQVPNFLKGADERPSSPLQLVVMDPLSAPLACDCVKGYAQRKYEKLGEFLSTKLRRKVVVSWSESLEKALQEKTDGKAHIIIGKHSVVLHDARRAKLLVTPIASLTDTKGKTTQTGLIVVRKDDVAKDVADLAGYRILFGPEECDEKYSAPMALLKKHKIELPKTAEVQPTCSTAAKALLELPADVKAAAVISSYAEPLLAGCGTINKGDLRVVGVSEEVPFVVAFTATNLDAAVRDAVKAALLEVGEHAELLTALETEDGFVEFSDAKRADAGGENKARAQASESAKKK